LLSILYVIYTDFSTTIFTAVTPIGDRSPRHVVSIINFWNFFPELGKNHPVKLLRLHKKLEKGAPPSRELDGEAERYPTVPKINS
jgi:hypothetical protein